MTTISKQEIKKIKKALKLADNSISIHAVGEKNLKLIEDALSIVKNLSLCAVGKSLPTKEDISLRAEKALFRFDENSRGWDDDYITGYEHGAKWIKDVIESQVMFANKGIQTIAKQGTMYNNVLYIP